MKRKDGPLVFSLKLESVEILRVQINRDHNIRQEVVTKLL